MNIQDTISTLAQAVQEPSGSQLVQARQSQPSPGRTTVQPDGQTPAVEPNTSSQAPLDRKDVEKLVTDVQKDFDSRGITLKFNLIDNSSDIQVEVMDSEKNKVIRKIPADELVKLSASIKNLAGVFVNKQS